MDFKISASDYAKADRPFGRVSGTLEPSYDTFRSTTQERTEFFASDGCMKLEFSSGALLPRLSMEFIRYRSITFEL